MPETNRIDTMEAALSLLIINWVQFTALLWYILIGCSSYMADRLSQPFITASSEDGSLIGQFLVCPAMSQIDYTHIILYQVAQSILSILLGLKYT